MRASPGISLSVCAALAAFWVTAIPVLAQQSPTCGWHLPDGRQSPASLEQLLDRPDELSETHQEAVGNLRKWIFDCDHTAARVAAMSLRSERRRTNSTDPFLRALLGLILVRGPDIHVLNAEGALIRPMNRHTNAEIEGVRLLTDVVEDTGWPEIVTELAAVAVITGKSESLKVTAESLRSVPDSLREAQFWTALGEVELARGEYDAARDAVEAIAPAGPRAARVLGIALMLDGRADAGATAYLEGLSAAAKPDVLHRYFDDIRLLLGPDEMAEWNTLDDGHAEWIRRKWEWRALLSGVRVGERLAEHHRRLEHVLRNYRRVSYRGAPVPTTLWTDTMMPDPMLLDDRGMIYLRHGAPTEELRIIPVGNPPAQRIAWTYSRPGPVQPVFEFDRGPDRADYFLAEPYPICGSRHVIDNRMIHHDSGTGFGYPVPGDLMDWSMRLSAFDPSLAMYYSRCHTSPDLAGNTFQTLVWEARRHGAEVLNSENAAPRLLHPLTASMNLYSFRAADATELAAYIAVHAGELSPGGSGPPLAYAFRILFAAGDPVTESIARRDTVIAFTQPQPLPQGAVVGTAVPMRVRSADGARITLSVINGYDSQQGQVMATSRDVLAFSDSALGLSDIVIAEPRDGAWIRGTSRLAPAQGHAILEGSPFRIYYELYNVDANDPLSVQVVVAPFDEAGIMERLRALIESRSALSIEFDEDAAPDRDGVVRTDRELAGELQPGSYVVTITVRNGRTGEVAQRETNLIVVEG
ncbi:MAG TPA: tetratricopeptide repeat protein [Longimicrobiales bacterium]|nr:tetratricopeptide repeat protein [Longimicrobiales bacterium]